MLRKMTLMGVAVAVAGLSITAYGQRSSLLQEDLPPGQQRPLRMEDANYLYNPPPLPRQFRLHDIVAIRVEELARQLSEGEMQQRKTASINAVLLNWLRLDGLFTIKPAPQADGDPRVQGQIQQLFRAEGELETQKRLTFNIAAEIVDVRPNGTLVIEARKRFQIDEEVWDYSLTGICRPDDVGPDNVLVSRDIVDLKIVKREDGHVRDSYKRGWLGKIIDRINPF